MCAKVDVGDALDAKVSTSDPSGSAKSIAYAMGGVALLYMIVQFGMSGGNWLTSRADGLLGTSAGDGGSGVTFDGSP